MHAFGGRDSGNEDSISAIRSASGQMAVSSHTLANKFEFGFVPLRITTALSSASCCCWQFPQGSPAVHRRKCVADLVPASLLQSPYCWKALTFGVATPQRSPHLSPQDQSWFWQRPIRVADNLERFNSVRNSLRLPSIPALGEQRTLPRQNWQRHRLQERLIAPHQRLTLSCLGFGAGVTVIPQICNRDFGRSDNRRAVDSSEQGFQCGPARYRPVHLNGQMSGRRREHARPELQFAAPIRRDRQ